MYLRLILTPYVMNRFKRDLEQSKHVTVSLSTCICTYLTQNLSFNQWMVSIFYVVAVLVDILLTSTLIAVLLKSRTGFRRSVGIPSTHSYPADTNTVIHAQDGLNNRRTHSLQHKHRCISLVLLSFHSTRRSRCENRSPYKYRGLGLLRIPAWNVAIHHVYIVCSWNCSSQAIIIPGNLVYIGVSIVGTKLYVNSVLAVYAFLPSTSTLYPCVPTSVLH